MQRPDRTKPLTLPRPPSHRGCDQREQPCAVHRTAGRAGRFSPGACWVWPLVRAPVVSHFKTAGAVPPGITYLPGVPQHRTHRWAQPTTYQRTLTQQP
eukprot:359579-Chlamydomonas_euryale.AAC.4